MHVISIQLTYKFSVLKIVTKASALMRISEQWKMNCRSPLGHKVSTELLAFIASNTV